MLGRNKPKTEMNSMESSCSSSARTSGQRSDNCQTKTLGASATIDLTIDHVDLTSLESTRTESETQMTSKRKGYPVIDLIQPASVAQNYVAYHRETMNQPESKKRKVRNLDSEKSYFSCAICLDDEVETWKRYSLSNCSHEFCLPCLGSHIQLSATKNIKCPSCPSHIELFDIQSVLIAIGKKDEWEKYSDKASISLLDKEILMGKNKGENRKDLFQDKQGNEITSCCPAERCNYIFVYKLRNPEFQEGTRFDCPKCFQSFCLQCGANDGKVGPAHKSTCCDRRQELLDEEKERLKFEEWKQENSRADAKFNVLLKKEREKGMTKACPECGFPITKNGGCDHMCCSQCEHDFNWSEN